MLVWKRQDFSRQFKCLATANNDFFSFTTPFTGVVRDQQTTNREWHFNWAINGDWCGRERPETRSVYYWQLKIWTIICTVSILALTSVWAPGTSPINTTEAAGLTPRAEIKAESDQCGLLITTNMICSGEEKKGKKRAVKCLMTMFVEHLAFNPAGPERGPGNDEEFKAAWKSSPRAAGNKR